jgi:hypothetical protein
MNPTDRKVAGLIALIVFLVAIIVTWHFAHRPKNPLVTTNGNGSHTSPQNVGDFDQFQQDLANRVLMQFGWRQRFQRYRGDDSVSIGHLAPRDRFGPRGPGGLRSRTSS